jgi:AmmeMemoRadiSam system protein A
MTSEADRLLLLQIARDAIAAHVGVTSAHGPGAPGSSDVLARPGGAFVSLHNQGDLRGCIGHIEATEPIGAVVPRCAVAACSSDPRFPHVTAPELEQIDIEISLLGPLEPIAGPQAIEVGRHGLVVEMGSRRGLLLPQVATEWKWDAETFLAQTCHKAGLARDAWKQGAKLWRFEAEVFGELAPRSLNTEDTKDTKENT